MIPDPSGASCETAETPVAEAAVTARCPDCLPDDPAARDRDRCAAHRDDDLIPRSKVVAELRDLALSWGRDMQNEIAGGALMDAAAHFEGTL